MISAYNFSLTGRDHKTYNMPCHDFSLIKEISPSWKIAVVADGVGSCAHADVAVKIAAQSAAELIEKQFPPAGAADLDYTSVIYAAMHGAANAIEEYVNQNDVGNELQYQTTLSLAVLSKKKLFYGNAGDSGIIGLDTNGAYHVLSHKQNDDIGRVYSIPSFRRYEVGLADFTPAAVLCMTDGVLDYIAPAILNKSEYPVDVPFANIFCTYALGITKEDEVTVVQKCKEQAIAYLSSDNCEDMTDDLSVAVLVVTDSGLLPECISWEKPEIDEDALKWQESAIYQSQSTRVNWFLDYLKQKHPTWTAEQLDEVVQKYLKMSTNDVPSAEHESSQADCPKHSSENCDVSETKKVTAESTTETETEKRKIKKFPWMGKK